MERTESTMMERKPTTTKDDPYLASFDKLIEPGAGKHPAWLFPLRKAGMARFAELGFPTLQHEDWRFTNVAPIAKLPFKPVAAADDGLNADVLSSLTFSKLPGARLVFVNGHYSTKLSTVPTLPAGAKVSSLASALASDADLIEKHLGQYARTEDNAFAALNTAFFQDGAFIHVAANVQIAEPIQVFFITTARDTGATIQPRNLVIAERGAQFTLIETYFSTVNATTFTNAVTEFSIGDNAIVEHIKFQDENPQAFHISTQHSNLGRACNFVSHSFALGAKLSRNNIRAKLDGEGLEAILNGLYLTRDEQLTDHHMIVEHAKPHCASHEYFNGILDDKSKAVFHGRILVQQAAQKTDAKQTNKNLLLSDDATADTKPQLEIYADDVKCTHGATVGQMNDDAIYYLRSRGIGLETARRMLMHAFAGEIIDRVRHIDAREELDKLIWARLEANPHLQAK